MRKSIEFRGAAAGLGLATALGTVAACGEPKQEACVVTAPHSDDLDVVMQGFARAINTCYSQTRPTLRERTHGSSHTVVLTVPTYDKGKVVINAQSAGKLKNGLPDPMQVTEVGAALYRSKKADTPWMPHPVISALRQADGGWELQYQSRDKSAGPSVAAWPNHLMVDGVDRPNTSQQTIDDARQQIGDGLRDLMDTAYGEVAHAVPGPTPPLR